MLFLLMGCTLRPGSEAAVRERAVGSWVCSDLAKRAPDAKFKIVVTFRPDGSYVRYVSFEDLDKVWRRNGYALADHGTWAATELRNGWGLELHVDQTKDPCRKAPSDAVRAACAARASDTTTFVWNGWTAGSLGTVGGSDCRYAHQDWVYDTEAPAPVAPPPAEPPPPPPPAPPPENPLLATLTSGSIPYGADLLGLYTTVRDDLACDPSKVRLDAGSLRVLRNTPFARAGYTFESEDLVAVFSRQSWYSPNPAVNAKSPPSLSPQDASCTAALRAAEDAL